MIDQPQEYYEKRGKHYVKIDYCGVPTEGVWYHGRRQYGTYHRKVTSVKLADITPVHLTRAQLAPAEVVLRKLLSESLAVNAYMFRDKWAFDDLIDAVLDALSESLAERKTLE